MRRARSDRLGSDRLPIQRIAGTRLTLLLLAIALHIASGCTPFRGVVVPGHTVVSCAELDGTIPRNCQRLLDAAVSQLPANPASADRVTMEEPCSVADAHLHLVTFSRADGSSSTVEVLWDLSNDSVTGGDFYPARCDPEGRVVGHS